MQPVLERGSIDKPLTFDVGLIQLSFIPVCSPNTCNISVKLRRGFALSAFHYYCCACSKTSISINKYIQKSGEPENDAGFFKHIAS